MALTRELKEVSDKIFHYDLNEAIIATKLILTPFCQGL
jgi:hypothetical protein